MTSPYQLTNRPSRVQPHDIDRYFLALHGLEFTVAVTGGTHDIAAQMLAVAGVAGENDQPVPNQHAALNEQGWVVTQANGTWPINRSDGDGGVPTFNGAEVTGWVSGNPGAFAINCVAFINGALTPATLEPGNYVAQLAYNHSFETVPNDALIGATKYRITQDPALVPVAMLPTVDFVVVATLNTIPDLSAVPRAGTHVKMIKNSLVYYSHDPTPVFTVAGQGVAYNPANAGTDLFPGDRLQFEYVT